MKSTHRGSWPLLVVLSLAALSARAQAADNLLAGRAPLRTKGVTHADTLTDGRAVPEGDFWKSTETSSFISGTSFAIFDLGSSQPIAAAWLQGDNNDVYEIAASDDGESFHSIWRAGPTPGAGMRARQSNTLGAHGRYVRVSASGGDGAFTLSEVQLFADPAAPLPPAMKIVRGVPLEQHVRDKFLLFGLALVLAVLLAYRGAPRWWLALLLVWPVIAGAGALIAFFEGIPLSTPVVSLARATIALVALAAVLREAFPPARFAAHRAFTLGTLGLCAVLSFLAFYNLGRPQFWDGRRGTWTFVHYLDLRQYYTTAKYFRELGYRGIYLADMAAYEEDKGLRPEQVDQLPIRDLDTLQVSTVGQKAEEIEAIRRHFSPARWDAFKRDSRYFRDVMGEHEFLETMYDMGGNATPVWMGIAHLMFTALPPGEGSFVLMGAIDPILLLLMFALIGRTFGLRTMFMAAVVFGANDFIMYGTNWAGATLRHDWLAYLGLAACALRRNRPALGGALLAGSTMIRAFPGLTFVAVTLPALWRLYEHWRLERRLPSLRTIIDRERATVRVLVGGVATMAALFLFSMTIVPAHAWVDWLHKVGQLSSDPHPSHISLRSLVAGWEPNQFQVLNGRMPVFIAAIAFFVVMVFVAARGRKPEQAAILGLPLIPVLLYPGNYYIHFVFLLPLLVVERVASSEDRPPLSPRDAGIWATLLVMCVAQYGPVLVTDLGLHFWLTSGVLFASLTGVLFFLVREQALAAGWWKPAT